MTIGVWGMGLCFRTAGQTRPPRPNLSSVPATSRSTLLGLPWLQAPLQDTCLRKPAHLRGWPDAYVTPERWYASPGAILPQRRSAGAVSDITAPAELFQTALSALDLLDTTPQMHEQDSGPQEDIAVEYGPTAASVGRAIYEVGCMLICMP